MFFINHVIVKFVGPDHVPVDHTAFTHESRTKAVQTPLRESHTEPVKVFGSHWHYCMMPVGKAGEETELEPPAVSGTAPLVRTC
jgi:hypothetical protein